MRVIFIRGLPGSGKSVVAEKLKEKLDNCGIIHADKFKLKAMKQYKWDFPKSCKYAYKQALEKLYLYHKKKKSFVIIEELIMDNKFFIELNKFLEETNSQAYWFRLERPLEKLLELENKRKRKIKNTKKDLLKIKRSINSIKIKDEIIIKNKDLPGIIKRILMIIKK